MLFQTTYLLVLKDLLNFPGVSILFAKFNIFGKNSTFTQSNSVRILLEIF